MIDNADSSAAVKSTNQGTSNQLAATQAVAGSAQSATSALNWVYLIGPGSGKKAHIPKVWNATAYPDRLEVEYGSLGDKLKLKTWYRHECINDSPTDELDKRAKEKLRKGYNYKK